MTHTVSPKSTRLNAVMHRRMTRDEIIVANAYSLPSYMTPDLEDDLLRDMTLRARSEGHIARMPPTAAKSRAVSDGILAARIAEIRRGA